MQVERTEKEVIIKVSAAIDTEDLQDLVNYARYKELTAGFSVPQEEVDEWAAQINREFWSENRKLLAK